MPRHVRLPDDSALDTEKPQRLCRQCILASGKLQPSFLPKPHHDLDGQAGHIFQPADLQQRVGT